MIISHQFRFIFFKPVKAAGTSVECFLQPLCQNRNISVNEYCNEAVSTEGIVGYRGPDRGNAVFWNHMSCRQVAFLQPEAFRSYTKISVIRNPYQKAISLFLWLGPLDYNQAMRMASEEPSHLKNIFFLFLQNQEGLRDMLTDESRHFLDGRQCIDRILTFESLRTDLDRIVKDLELPLDLNTLGRYKDSGGNGHPHEVRSFFSQESISIVNRLCGTYCDYFGYSRYGSIEDLATSTKSITRS
jgi:hypothetical protein